MGPLSISPCEALRALFPQGCRRNHDHGRSSHKKSAASQEAALWQGSSKCAQVLLGALKPRSKQQGGADIIDMHGRLVYQWLALQLALCGAQNAARFRRCRHLLGLKAPSSTSARTIWAAVYARHGAREGQSVCHKMA